MMSNPKESFADRVSAIAMHDAIKFDDVAKVRALLEAGFDANTYVLLAVDRYRALHMAASSGRLEICELLIEAGADVNASSERGTAPLMSACGNGDVAICRLLQAHGARLDCVSEGGVALLELAVRCDMPAVVEWLLTEGAHPNAPNKDGHVPLRWVCSGPPAKFKEDLARILVEAGADPSIVPANSPATYRTPLQHAVHEGDVDAVKFYVERFGIDLGQKTRSGSSLTRLANSKPDMAAYLRSLKSEAAVASAVASRRPLVRPIDEPTRAHGPSPL